MQTSFEYKIREVTHSENIFLKLSDLELSVRCQNCLKNEGMVYIGDLVHYTELRLLGIQNFGRKTLRELQALLDSLELRLGMNISGWSHEIADAYLENNAASDIVSTANFCKTPLLSEEETLQQYESMGLFKKVELLNLSERCANCLRAIGVLYVGDLVIKNEFQLLRTVNFGRKSLVELRDALSPLNLRFGMQLKFWPPSNLEELAQKYMNKLAHSAEDKLINAFTRTLEKIKNPRDMFVVKSRMGMDGNQKTLEMTGQNLNITRERVRQIQKKTIRKILANEVWDDILRIRLRKLTSQRSTPLYLDSIEIEDPWFEGFVRTPALLQNIIEAFSEREDIYFITIDGKKILTSINWDTWQEIRGELLNYLDHSLNLSHSMEDIEMYVEAKLSAVNSTELSSLMFDSICNDLNFVFMNGNMILSSVGNSSAGHIRALLEMSTVPLHYERIAALYHERYNVSVSSRYVHACLNTKDFLLFGRGTYGLEKHIPLSQIHQTQILDEIEKIIELGLPHKQWHSNDLVGHITCHGYIDKYLINIILHKSRKLRYLGKFIWKQRSNGDEEIERLQIKTAVYLALKNSTGPLHLDMIQSLVASSRGMGANFILLPNEIYSKIDAATWGLLERDFFLTVEQQKFVRDHFYNYFVSRKSALHKSELLNAAPETILLDAIKDGHLLGILLSDQRFKCWHGGLIGLSSWIGPNRKALTEVIEDIAWSVGTYIHIDEVLTIARKELGYDFNRYSISQYLNRNGLQYDKDKGLWKRVVFLKNQDVNEYAS